MNTEIEVMDKTIKCLALELHEVVWKDVAEKWNAVKLAAASRVPEATGNGKNRFTTLTQVMTIIDEWLSSDDTFVTDGEGGEKLPNAWIDCVKGSLLKRMVAIVPEPTNKNNLEYWESLAISEGNKVTEHLVQILQLQKQIESGEDAIGFAEWVVSDNNPAPNKYNSDDDNNGKWCDAFSEGINRHYYTTEQLYQLYRKQPKQ